MARVTIKKDGKKRGKYIVSGCRIKGKYVRQRTVTGKRKARQVATSRRERMRKK